MSLRKLKEDVEQKQRQDEMMASIIFDDHRVVRRAVFPMQLVDGQLAFGVMLPKMVDVTNRHGDVVGQEQRYLPYYVISTRELIPVGKELAQRYRLHVKNVPDGDAYPHRWSLESIRDFLRGDAHASLADVFERVREQYARYMYFHAAEWYDVHALWDISTYFFMGFKYFPLLELRGVRGSAKTKIFTISRMVTFNASEEMTNPSEASLFRMTEDQRPTRYIDEAEQLWREERGKLEEDNRCMLLNAGYKHTGSVPRVEKIGGKFVTVWYAAYSPVMLASIKGLRGATEDRAIVHITTKAPANDPRNNSEPSENAPEWQTIRNNLYVAAMLQSDEVFKAYSKLDESGLAGRDHNLWRGLLAVAKVVSGDLFDRVLAFAKGQTKIKTIDVYSDRSWEYRLLKYCFETPNHMILIKDLALVIDSENPPASKTVGRIMDGLGFRDFKNHTREGAAYRLEKDYVRQIVEMSIPEILQNTSLSSLSSLPSSLQSHSSEFAEIENEGKTEDSSHVTKTTVSVTKKCDESEESDGVTMNPVRDFLRRQSSGHRFTTVELLSVCRVDANRLDAQLRQLVTAGDIAQVGPEEYIRS